jgi:hypothetical protein
MVILRRNPGKPIVQYIVIGHDPLHDFRPSCRDKMRKLQEAKLGTGHAVAPDESVVPWILTHRVIRMSQADLLKSKSTLEVLINYRSRYRGFFECKHTKIARRIPGP